MGTKRKRPANDTVPATQTASKKQKSTSNITSKAAPIATPLDTSPFLDNPKAADLKREVHLYDTLSSEDSSERLNAANAIVSGLLDGDGVEESTLQRHLERRLFRGLASGRKGARLGFSVVLTEILGQLFGKKDLARTKYRDLTFDKVLGFLVAKTKPDGDLSGQEEKDHFLGLLFGLQTFVRAKVLFGDSSRWNLILEKLLELSKKKPWVREECGWVVIEALSHMTQEEAEYTLTQLQEAGLASSPEGVGIWITARIRFQDMRFPSKPWGQGGNPLQHLKSLAKALKESSSTEGKSNANQAKQTGNWNPQLHFVWNIVLSQYASEIKSKTHGLLSDFENFWKVAVDENLFSATASKERKFWGLLLFQKLLQDPDLYRELYPSVFSHNLVRCLVNHVQEQGRFLNRAADKSLKILIATVETHPDILPAILPHLVGGNGTYNFDKVTKTKTVERLLSHVDDANAETIVELLLYPAISVQDSDPYREAELRRHLLGDYILSMIRQIHVADGSHTPNWVGNIALPKLADVAYVHSPEWQPPVSEKTRTLFRNRLMSAFGYLLSDLQGYTYPCELLTKFSPTAVKMDAGITEAKDRALSALHKIKKKLNKAKNHDVAPLQALALLYSLVVFQLYNGEAEAVSILEELKICYNKLLRNKGAEDAEGDASEVLVELLLSFISKPSALLRKVTQHVFIAFMADVTGGGLKLMTDVLASKENLRGQQELFDHEPDDAAGEEDAGEDDSDVEVVDMDADEGTINGNLEEENSDEDENEEEEASEEEEADDEASKKLDEALAAALGTRPLTQNGEDEVSSSDADMTDSEMMALDSKLVEIFSQRKKEPNKRKENKDAKETMVNFKTRILDLLDLYVKKQSANPLAFGLLLPLLQLMRTTKTKSLSEKAHNIIIAFARAAKKGNDGVSELDSSAQLKLLKEIHTEASKDRSHVFAKGASTASLLLASSLYRADKASLKKVAKVYMESQVKWVGGEWKMQAAFFAEWVNWCQSHANLH